jgi:hypothetical protein
MKDKEIEEIAKLFYELELQYQENSQDQTIINRLEELTEHLSLEDILAISDCLDEKFH